MMGCGANTTFKNGRRNPYADRLKGGTNLVLIEPDCPCLFSDERGGQ